MARLEIQTAAERPKTFHGPRIVTAPQLSENVQALTKRYFPKSQTILEVGAGKGGLRSLVSESFAEKMTHLDYDFDDLTDLRKLYPDARVVQADGRRLPFPDNTFDGYIGLTTYTVLRIPEVAAREAHRVLKPGEHFLHIADVHPQRSNLLELYNRVYPSKRLLPADAVVDNNHVVTFQMLEVDLKDISAFMQRLRDDKQYEAFQLFQQEVVFPGSILLGGDEHFRKIIDLQKEYKCRGEVRATNDIYAFLLQDILKFAGFNPRNIKIGKQRTTGVNPIPEGINEALPGFKPEENAMINNSGTVGMYKKPNVPEGNIEVTSIVNYIIARK